MDEESNYDKGTIYSNPEAYGLELVSEVNLDADSYSFDMVVIWGDVKTKNLYVGRDSGCSCPSPFESAYSRGDLEEVNPRNIEQFQMLLRDAGVSILDIIELLEEGRQQKEKEECQETS